MAPKNDDKKSQQNRNESQVEQRNDVDDSDFEGII